MPSMPNGKTRFVKVDGISGAKPLSLKEFTANSKERLAIIQKEFSHGFKLIHKYPLSVTFFGSSRLTEKNPLYKKAQRIAEKLSRKGYAIVTGGGPGIMEGANRGGYEAGGVSVGFTIDLPNVQRTNRYVGDGVEFLHFFSRKVILSFSAEAYLFFPGGFGTLDEFFEIITLVQTKKIPPVPIILVGKAYWRTLERFLRTVLCKKFKTISEKDLKLYAITDDENEIVRMVQKAPMRKE